MTTQTLDNGLTASGAGLGMAGMIFAQAGANPETVTIIGAVVALATLMVRAASDAYKTSQETKQTALIHDAEMTKLRDEVAKLTVEKQTAIALAKQGVCPLSTDGNPACGREMVRGASDGCKHGGCQVGDN